MGDKSDLTPLIGDDPRGAAAALAEAGPGAPPAGDQLVLPIGAKAQNGAVGAVVVRSRSGRPPGSKNRATQAWAKFLNSAYGSPLEALASIYAQDVLGLAKHLGCTALEALKLQIRCAELVAPYVHAKQPLSIEGGGTYAPTSIFVNAQLEPQLVKALRDQGVTEAELDALGRGELDVSRYAERDQGVIEHVPITANHRADPE